MNTTPIPSARRRRSLTRVAVGVAAVVLSAAGVTAVSQPADGAATPGIGAYVPPVKHVFVINLENKGYDARWGPGSAAPYPSQTLRSKGVLLNTCYGTAHNSQPNYFAQISGQGPNRQMQADCQVYTPFVGAGAVRPNRRGRRVRLPRLRRLAAHPAGGQGADLEGYLEDMGTPCRQPALGAVDDTQKAKIGDEYAARHNPFIYFSAITGSPSCAQHDVDLSQPDKDLASTSATPNLSYITPNLCHDGHDSPCVDGRPGGLASADAWLKTWVPKILSSPAFGADGELIITADEADSPQSDATACCGEGPGPNSPLPGITGAGGGRVGALVLSRWTTPDTWSTTPYNHYALLASLEDVFRLPYLGYAATPGLNRFGLDFYNKPGKF